MSPTYRPLAASLWMAGAVASFTTMAIAGREVSGTHDTFEIMLWRSLVGLSFVVVLGSATGRLAEVRTKRLKQHLFRNLVHFAGQNLWFLALTLIPLAQVFALEFTSPLWVILLAPLVLGERISRRRALAALVGFAGILIVARPDFGRLDPGVLAASAAALCFAATLLMTKTLIRHESILSILFWLTLMQLLLSLGFSLWDGKMAWPTKATLPWLMLIGLAGVAAHLCLTSALSLAPASFVVPMDFARLPIIAVVGAVFYDEPIEMLVIFGGCIIILANWINISGEKRDLMQQEPMTKL